VSGIIRSGCGRLLISKSGCGNLLTATGITMAALLRQQERQMQALLAPDFQNSLAEPTLSDVIEEPLCNA
jgi:hypothetical protein